MSVPHTPQKPISSLIWFLPQTGSSISRISRFPSPGANFTSAFTIYPVRASEAHEEQQAARNTISGIQKLMSRTTLNRQLFLRQLFSPMTLDSRPFQPWARAGQLASTQNAPNCDRDPQS